MPYSFCTINEAAKLTGHPPYRLRQWILKKNIRFNKAGNRYIINLQWLEEDLKKMAEQNMSIVEKRTSEYGKLRRIGGT